MAEATLQSRTNLLSRSEARLQGQKYFRDDHPCKHGNLAPRTTSSGVCICDQCANDRRQYSKDRRAKFPELMREMDRASYARNPEPARQVARDFYAKNKDQVISRLRKRRSENPDLNRKICRKWREKNTDYEKTRYGQNRTHHLNRGRVWRAANRRLLIEKAKQWRKANPDLHAAQVAKRRVAKLQATPKWLTPSDILAMAKLYKQARILTVESGMEYHVDHIVPLRGKLVCGLHVPWNLQILTANDNIRKSNSFEVAA